MSESTLTSLLEYLYGTLTPSNQIWVAERLIEHAEADSLRPYTMDEINTMLDESEAEIAAGIGVSHEEMMREWDEEIASLEQKELEMAEAV
jgi:hypothetical protein